MRLFVAIDIPDEIRAALAEACATLKPVTHNARWVRPESLHLTLKFIGEQPEENVEAIRGALAGIQRPTFRIALSGLYLFPNPRRFPLALVAAVWRGAVGFEEIGTLAKQVDFELSPLKVAKERREFLGHVTVARLDPRAMHDALEAALAGMMRRDWGEFEVREFHLYRSELKRGGAVYTRVATFSLSEG